MGSWIVFIVFIVAYLYLEMPVLAPRFTDWSNLLLFCGLFLIWIALKGIMKHGAAGFSGNSILGRLFEKILYKNNPNPNHPKDHFSKDHIHEKVVHISDQTFSKKYRRIAHVGLAFIVISLINTALLPIITSNVFMFNQDYRNLLGPVQESSFTADIAPINLSQIRIIDQETAIKLADKKIGEIPALGSSIRLGELSLQKVQGKLYYVAPLEHRGLFQWLSNLQGSRGYIMVSATNPQDVRLVESVKGQEVRLKYQTNSFFFDYLPRYLYFHGYFSVGMTDFSFELDDELNPYWVVTLYTKKIGYSGDDAKGIVTVNAITGEIKEYGMNDVPAWVDRIQPEAFVYKQIRDWGEYVNGYWNSVFSKTGMLKPTGTEMNLIYGNDNNIYWYTGITSSGRDDSSVGFILVNSRTKDARWYKVAGATEEAAKRSAEGQVQEKAYRAGYPVLYNINGVPTYIAPLKDKEGLLKLVAFISVENYNIVGVGPDIESAMRSYQQNIVGKGDLFVPTKEALQLNLHGKIMRISQVVKGGESYYYFTIDTDKRIFIGTISISAKIPLIKEGDIVDVTINNSTESPIGILKFETANY